MFNFLMPQQTATINQVMAALQSIRAGVTQDEYELHEAVARHLEGLPYQKEYRLGPRCRIDFFIPEGIGIEVKRGKQYWKIVCRQLERYLSFPEVTSVIVVSERALYLPGEIRGKPCFTVCLGSLWGVALP